MVYRIVAFLSWLVINTRCRARASRPVDRIDRSHDAFQKCMLTHPHATINVSSALLRCPIDKRTFSLTKYSAQEREIYKFRIEVKKWKDQDRNFLFSRN